MAAPQINTAVCSMEDVQQALQTVQTIVNQFTTVIDTVTASDHKVIVNGSDVAPGYLHAKIQDAGTFSASCVAIRAQTVSNLKEQFFFDAQDVAGFEASVPKLFTYDGVQWVLVDFVGFVDTQKVLVTSGDTTASYLHDAFNLNATYVGNADILVGTATVGAAASNQTERLFVDVSAISGWAGTGTFLLGIVNNVSQYIAMSSLVTEGYAIDISGTAIGFDPTEITGFAASFQFFGHLAAASANTDPGWFSVASYDATKDQMWWHQSGAFKFQTTTGYDATKKQSLSHDASGAWAWTDRQQIYLAITTEAVPAATGNYTSGNITPGKTAGSSNIRLYTFGTNYGDGASQGSLKKAENYMFAGVAAHKPVFVVERATDIFAIISEGCAAFPA